MDVCGVHDFKFMDIIQPKGLRFNRQLSGLINFCKFRETDWMDMLLEGADEMDKATDVHAKLTQEKEELLRKIKEQKCV